MAVKTNLKKQLLDILLIAFIVIYPFISSFFGIDIGDTGIHYTNFKYIYSRPDIVGYSTVFTSMIGNVWIKLFGNLGIWSLNLLEVIIEWIMATITYSWLTRYLQRTYVLVGISIAVITTGCYLNVFNYHQFSVFLILSLLYLVFLSISKNNIRYTFGAGVVFALAVFARVSSFVCITVVFLYIYAASFDKKMSVKNVCAHITAFLSSAVIMMQIFLRILKYNGILQGFINSIIKLNTMANTEKSSYSTENLISNLIWGSIKTLASPMLLLGAAIMLIIAIYFFLSSKNWITKIGASAIFIIISLYLVDYSYGVNPVDASPQNSTGFNFVFGISFFVGILLIVYEKIKKNRDMSLLALMSILLPLYVTAGSNTGTKHVILSMWLVAPLIVFSFALIYKNIEKIGALENVFQETQSNRLVYTGYIIFFYVLLAVSVKYVHMIYNTNNFDSIHRTEITEKVQTKQLKYLHTTQREKDALEGLISSFEQINQEQKMVVFGSGIGLYAVLDAEPYTRAWVTDSSYSNTQFENALQQTNEELIVVYCKTNQYFGFEESNYSNLIYQVKSSSYNGKKNVLKDFLTSNEYSLNFENGYYCLFSKHGNNICTSNMIDEIFY